MRSAASLLLGVVLVAPTAARAEVAVRVASDQVAIDASAAPLSDVLDRLARQTGMEIVYEGSPPRQRITLALEGRTPTEAVLAILEGQGLNYALVADPTGAKVQTLIIAGAAGTGTSTGSSSSTARTRNRRPRRPPIPETLEDDPAMMEPDFDELEEEDPFEFEDPAVIGQDAPAPPGTGDGAAPAAEAPVPAAGPMPFPGGQQVFPASPFTPQPTYPQPVAPRPPGAGPDQGAAPPPTSPP